MGPQAVYKAILLAVMLNAVVVNGRSLEQPRYATAYACEGSTLSIECREGELIHLIRANYGRFSITICNEHGNTEWSVNCMSPKSLRVLHNKCTQQQNCSILASTSTFGDPCPGTLKYLEAHYQCMPATTTTTTNRPSPPWLVTSRPGSWSTPKAPTSKGGAPEGAASSTPMPTPAHPQPSAAAARPRTPGDDPPSSLLPLPDGGEGEEGVVVVVDEGPKPGTDELPVSSVTALSIPGTPASPPVSSTPVGKTTGRPTSAPGTIHPELTTPSPSVPWLREGESSQSCNPTTARDLYWNWTGAGEVAVQPCPGGAIGVARWQCLGSGQRSPDGPDLGECRSVWLTSLESRVEEGDSIMGISNDLAQVTASKILYGGDMMTTTKIVKKMAQKMSLDIRTFPDPRQREAIVTELLHGVVRTGSNLLDSSQKGSWRDLTYEEQMRVATSLLIGLEENAFLLADTVVREKEVIQLVKNILLSVRVLETRNVGVEEFPSPAAWDQWNASRDWVQLPRAALLENGEGGLVRLVFIAFDRLEEVLRPQPVSPSWRDGMNVMRKATRVLNSKVISASLGKGRHIQLSSPVRISLRHIRTENVSDPACVFWDYTTSSWSEEGCRVESTNISHTLCQCDHLTNFAVLMDIHSTLLNPPHQTALQIITYVGCIISSVCLVLAIITFQLFRGLKSDRTTIHKNLCVCLLVAEVLFLAGIGQTDKPVVCGIVAGLLHFFFLCAFAWMFLEGFQLYVMLIEVFETEKSRMRWYYIFAYGAPLIIVIVSCVVDPLSYGTQRYCWLRADNFFIFSFVGPVIAVILANLVFLSMAIYKMCRHANASVSIKSKEHSRLASARAWLRGAIVLVFLLGLTWTFGLLYLNEESIIMAYIFTVLNSLQGLFIFVFHCVQNEKVRKEYRKFVRRNSWLPKCLQCSKNSSSKERRSSFYAGSNGNPSAPNSHSTDSSALSPHGTSYFLQRGWSTRSSSRPKASVGPSVARCSHLAPCPTAASNPSDLEAEVCASSAAKTNTGISLPYASGHSHPHIPKSATCGLLHNPLLWKNISFKSYSRDSGHGGSEQEDLPRSHNLAMQNSLNNVRSLNNSKDSRRLPYMPPDYHQGITNDLSVTHCPSIDVEHSSGIHCAPRAVMSTTEEPHARRPDAAALPQYSARQGHLLPALHQGARGSKKSSNGLHRSMSPWNHTYTEIREGHQLSHPLVKFHAHTLGLPEDDPVYEEIERNDAQVSDVSDEDMKRQSDTSRQSSRSYGDHRPLIPYSPASDRNFQNCIEDALKKKLRELHHLESSVRGAHSDIGEGGPESPMGGHVEVATSESDFPVVVPGGCDPPSAPESLSFAGENARTVAVLDGETVVCHLRPENELYACDPFNSRTIELSPYSEC
ncbi:latrophilin Cirl-like isoform X2 [Ischnura elegans]|uniref:latrophilin Cirl-like isoform X2 n=1 Tax=Ischnura elegans TaxID=197161 RepID=UPI001ED8884A|nr:latrophilin Cirl-like isoform X2 [Ischnura elegans]